LHAESENSMIPSAHMGYLDAHSDALLDVAATRGRPNGASFVDKHLPRLMSAGVTHQFLTVGGDFPLFASDLGHRDGLRECLAMIDVLHCEIEESRGRMLLVRDPGDLAAGGLAAVAHLEGVGFLAGDAAYLRLMYRLGVRSVGLTWNDANPLADGCGTARDAGLTPRGRAVVEQARSLRILVDVSHMSERGARETLDVSDGPVIASHSNCRGVYDHPRNLTDDLVRDIASAGGVVCIAALPDLLSAHGRPDISDMLRHIEHLVDLVGPSHVGIGCDFVNLPASMLTSAPVAEHRAQLERPFPRGFTSPGDLRSLAHQLASRGWDSRAVAAVMGDNVRSLLQRVL